MLSFECIKNEKSVYFLLTSAQDLKKGTNIILFIWRAKEGDSALY